jgi:hypothetical protein
VIDAFPDRPSVCPGEPLTLHVRTDAPRFRVDFYRWGAEPASMGGTDWWDGRWAPAHLPFQDWSRPNRGPRGEELPGWPGYRFDVPPDWPSGVYLAVFVEEGTATAPLDGAGGHTGRCLFVLRAAAPTARILYKLPLLTYHAYNQVAARPNGRSWCLYTVPERFSPPSVSVRRPGGGVGGTPWDRFNFDPFDRTPRQTFQHWDAPFIRWLERSGYRLDYCTDLDLHRRPPLGYRLLVSAGHDEYWSEPMRAHAERFVAGGGNIAFFSGNTCWWRVSFDDPSTFRRLDNWPGHPENGLTGVSFRNGGERDRDDHPIPVGYRVQHADHWVFAGTGLRDGDTLGGRSDDYLVGYECDGAHFDRADLGRRPVRPTGDDGTPGGFTILGVGDTAPSGWGLGNRAATLGLYTRGGTVFTAATTDWPRLAARHRAPVTTITRNVLDRLG